MAHSLQHPLNSASSEPKAGIINDALVVSIVGPTASGKSALAQSVALELDGEVVSADSMQIYRFMDIGTAKLKPEERLVKHHLLDIVDPRPVLFGAAFSRSGTRSIQGHRHTQ